MKSRALVAVGAAALVSVALVAPAAPASAGNNMKGTMCDNGLFHVIHKGNRIDGVRIKQGYYRTYVNGVQCKTASRWLTSWLSTGTTTRNYLVAAGTRGPKSTMFSKGQGPRFFQIKWVMGG